MHISKKYFYASLFLGLALFQVSFMAWIWPVLNLSIFIILTLAVLILSLKDLRWGAMAVLLELILGSKGYLFFADINNHKISWRMALYAILLIVSAVEIIRHKRWHDLKKFKSKDYWPLGLLFISVLIGLVTALFNHYPFNNIYQDANAYLFWLLIVPFALIDWKKDKEMLLSFLAGALSAIAIETLWLSYAFSHNLAAASLAQYAWLRDNGLAEITSMSKGYYRIFLQSQIYLIFGFGVAVLELIKTNSNKYKLKYFVLASLFLSPLIISLSRSFWIGLAVLWVGTFLLTLKNKQKLIFAQFAWLSSVIVAIVILLAIVNFPWPRPQATISADIIASRASEINNEAGANSRWSLLPKLFKADLKSPVIGSGFGSTITYISSDPRILDKNPSGQYTTFSFEWGWLDLWLKLGIIGALAYAWLILRLAWKYYSLQDYAISLSILSLAAVHVFSPYLNHPLGIGLLIFALVWPKK